MPLSDTSSPTRHPIDWRAWVSLAWVLWFGFLYAKMVVEQRGQRLPTAFVRWVGKSASEGR
jgi:hypothetical protein